MLGSPESVLDLPAGTVGIQNTKFHARREDDRGDLHLDRFLDRPFFVAVFGFRKLAVDREADEAFELLVFAVFESEMQSADEHLLHGPEGQLFLAGQDPSEVVVDIDVQRQHLVILNHVEAIVEACAFLDFVLVSEVVDFENLANDLDDQVLETEGLCGFGHEFFLLGAFLVSADSWGSQPVNLPEDLIFVKIFS